ncbi:MAG: preprotein translocase subunit SecA [bacterium]|nr:preprotein translocase subunit SecA [bacterium]
MFTTVFSKVFGTANDRALKRLQPTVDAINALSPEIEKLSDEDLKARTPWLQKRLKNGETVDDVLVDAFATVREAAKRTLGERHYDVQLIGGVVLHRGGISEMKTGEGKTLVSTLPLYLNALEGKGAHLVTVNDYLAKRDNEWMGQVHRFLGLTVGCILHNMDDKERREAYACDITYGTNNEFGFDYLRDNMKFSLDEMVQRPFNFALVDEVDNILIDEARTPLIISGPAEDSSEMYKRVNILIPGLKTEDYEYDEKSSSVTLTEAGNQHVEDLARESDLISEGSLYDVHNVSIVHHVNQALRAHVAFQKEKDYIVKDDEVVIIDEFTGRMMEGRRYSDGLHQALEAKEGATIQVENQTLASITFQNYFRLYPKLAGMTGTADTEAAELAEIYSLETVLIPTNKDLKRKDYDDEVYRTEKEKYEAIIKLIKKAQERGQPVLVGTTSIEKSEFISALFKKSKIDHKVLNARYHEQEAHIITQAGAPGAVTIATNMAGRGTDIQLGGNVEALVEAELAKASASSKKDVDKDAITHKVVEQVAKTKAEVLEAGGLYVVGTERHESRRIDNQLRGRSGRQGDPGGSKFFLSLDDDLMRIFAAKKRLDGILKKLGLEDGEAITHPMVNRSLEKAQCKVEARNFEVRKQLLKYDDVMNNQRKVIYEQRRDIMKGDEIHETVMAMREDAVERLVSQHIPEQAYANDWDVEGLHAEFLKLSSLDLPLKDWVKEEGIADVEIRERLIKALNEHMDTKEEGLGPELCAMIERSALLRQLDHSWKEHLRTLDNLRQCIHLRAYGQRDPLNEFKSEAFSLFGQMVEDLNSSVTQLLSYIQVQQDVPESEVEDAMLQRNKKRPLKASHPSASRATIQPDTQPAGVTPMHPGGVTVGEGDFEGQSVRRNEPCPCGSGKRYKHCHGR